jgi:CDP-diglyceride synthetase
MKFIVYSNIFFLIPVIAALLLNEWIYFAIGLSACIFSPIYHYLRENHSKHTTLLSVVRKIDWLCAITSYAYMYYFVVTRVSPQYQGSLITALTLTIMFFWYGFKFGNYQRAHPWFHVILPFISLLVVTLK